MSFEAQSISADMWKKLVDSVKDLVTEGNIQCTPDGITLQAMDTAHVALVSLSLEKNAFKAYHMEGARALGINMTNFAKILKTIDSKDVLTLRHQADDNVLQVCADDPEKINNNKKNGANGPDGAATRSSEYNLKLMEIESEEMGVPDIEYKCQIHMSTTEFARICRDMNVLGDTITVSVDRHGVAFSADGDIGGGKHKYNCPVTISKMGGGYDREDDVLQIKQEVKMEVKAEVKDETGLAMDGSDEDSDEDVPLVNRLRANKDDGEAAAPAGKKKKKGGADNNKGDADEKRERFPMRASMSEPVELSFALRYFTIFSKAANLSEMVTLSLSAEHPCQIEYTLNKSGHLRFFLAPKVEAGE